jgi:hypothetical protein
MRAMKQKSGLARKNAELRKNAVDGEKLVLKP